MYKTPLACYNQYVIRKEVNKLPNEFKETKLWILEKKARKWTCKQPVLAQTMIGRKSSFDEKRAEETLFKSPWGSYIEIEQDDKSSFYYCMTPSCILEKFTDKQLLEDFLLSFIIK